MGKKTIPKRLRELVWIHYIGNFFEGKCFCCKGVINVFNWQAGHVIPESKSGQMTLENLRPICASCNSSMGNKFMSDFVKSHQLPGIEFFTKREIVQVGNRLILH